MCGDTVYAGDNMGANTTGADRNQVFIQTLKYERDNPRDAPPKDFVLEPLISLYTYKVVDNKCDGRLIEEYVYPGNKEYVEKTGLLCRRYKDVSTASYNPYPTVAAVGVEIPYVTDNGALLKTPGTVRIDFALRPESHRDLYYFLDNNTNVDRIRLSNRTQVTTMTGKHLQKLVEEEVRDACRGYLAGRRVTIPEIDNIESDMRDIFNKSSFFTARHIVLLSVSLRPDRDAFTRISDKKFQADIEAMNLKLDNDRLAMLQRAKAEADRIMSRAPGL